MKHISKLLLYPALICLFSIAFVSCEDDNEPKGEPITYGNTNITDHVVWEPKNNPHTVDGTISVREGGHLTIMPGTVIKMTTRGEFNITGLNSVFSAVGTEDKPILITSASASPAPGNWRQIRFGEGAVDCIIEYCTIEYGGSNNSYGMIDIRNNAQVQIRNSVLQYSNHLEVKIDNTHGFNDFSNNTIRSERNHAMMIRGRLLPTVNANNDFIVGPNLGVLLSGFATNTIYIDEDGTWPALNTPYIVEDPIRLRSNATLTILPGAELRFISGKHLEVGYSSPGSDPHARLIAVGTIDKPIIFTSASAAPQKGDWNGIRFSRHALSGSVLEHCDIGYAGGTSTYKANVLVDPCGPGNPRIANSVIHNSNRWGIYTNYYQQAYGDPLIEDVLFHDNTNGDIGSDN